MSDLSEELISRFTDLKDIVLGMKCDIDRIKNQQDEQKKKELIDKCVNFGLPFKLNAYVPPPEDTSCSSKGKEKLVE